MLRRGGIGVLHDRRQRCLDVDGVNRVAFQQAVEVERAAGARRRDHGNPWAVIVPARRGVTGNPRLTSIRAKAGQGDDVAAPAALYRNPGNGGRSAGSAACAAGAGIGRNTTVRGWVRSAPTAFFSRARAFARKPTPRTTAPADAATAARSA